ncbi:MAG: hypothetical protein ACI8ZN_002087 [Bacteroidia bacterium]|jgi:hypothetical protein
MKINITFGLIVLWMLVTSAGKSDSFSRANAYMEGKNYDLAVEMYEKAMGELPPAKKTSRLAEITKQLAIAHFKMKHYLQSEWYFDQIMQGDIHDAELLFDYAQLQQVQGRLSKAITYYELWAIETERPVEAKNYIDFCKTLLESQHSEVTLKVELASISTDQHDEFCPSISPFGYLVYTSNRPTQRIAAADVTIPSPTNLYQTDRLRSGSLQNGTPVLKPSKNSYNQGSACFSADGQSMFYTGNIVSPVKPFSEDASQYTLGIFESRFNGYKWGKPVLIEMDNRYNCAFPAVSADGNMLIFSSDMLPGHGGMDLFVTYRGDNGWTKAVNLGAVVNSTGNEVYPFILTENNTKHLYFSSDGRPGHGGLDLYSSSMDQHTCDSITLLPAPLNSSYDDFGYTAGVGNNFGFFSSNRAGTDDVYRFTNGVENNGETKSSHTIETVIIEKHIIEEPVSETVQEEGTPSNKEGIVDSKNSTTSVNISENKTIEEPAQETVTLKIKMEESKPKYVESYEVAPTHSNDYLEYDQLNGYYVVMYSALNANNLRSYRNRNFPDALLIKNKNGFYHIAYWVAYDKETAEEVFAEKEELNKEIWLFKP